MAEAFKAGHPVTLEKIDRFVDGAAVKRIGDLTFSICREVLDDTGPGAGRKGLHHHPETIQ